MTREQAIQVIQANGLFYVPENTPTFEMLKDALDLAIDALETQLQECKVMPVSCDKKYCELCKDGFCTADILILNSDGVCEL